MRLLTIKATAAILEVAPITVVRLFDSGALPGVVLKQGKRKRIIRFRDETLQKFITGRERRGGK